MAKTFKRQTWIWIASLAVFLPHLYGRLGVLITIMSNHPDRINDIRKFPQHEILFKDRLLNCEDIALVESHGTAILSCDCGRNVWNTVMGVFTHDTRSIPSGSLFLYRYDHGDSPDNTVLQEVELLGYPAGGDFHPLGIEYDENSHSLFVCNHKTSGSTLELFYLDLSSNDPTARHIRTISHALLKSPNGISLVNAQELLVTSDHYFLIRYNRWLALLETYAGLPGGSVLHVDLQSDEIRLLARVPFANGIVLLNSSTVAVASSSTATVRLFELQEDRSLKTIGSINVPFSPDNLSRVAGGVLLITGHPHPYSLERMAISRSSCLPGDSHENCIKSKSPSWVAQWAPSSGLTTIYRSRSEFGSSTTAVQDPQRGIGIITGLYESGILRWRDTM